MQKFVTAGDVWDVLPTLLAHKDYVGANQVCDSILGDFTFDAGATFLMMTKAVREHFPRRVNVGARCLQYLDGKERLCPEPGRRIAYVSIFGMTWPEDRPARPGFSFHFEKVGG
jgi:hypothetical protein